MTPPRVHFRLIEAPSEARTQHWWVETENGMDRLGIITWYDKWQKYTFCPQDAIQVEEVCLREIADFIVARTQERG